MCGIVGYIGKRDAVRIAISGLKRLEYRGYDSAGLAVLGDNGLQIAKERGKVAALEQLVLDWHSHLAIAHTRWATHGEPSQKNAHPHTDKKGQLALVHNGIIENYKIFHSLLEAEGVHFVSDTDTEVIAHLIAKQYCGDLLQTMQRVMSELRGSFAFALLHSDYPDKIFVAARHLPMVIGIGEGEHFIASDARAFVAYTRQVIYLADGECAFIHSDRIELFDSSLRPISRSPLFLNYEVEESSLGEYEHYTLKEICNQPEALRQAIAGRYSEEYGTAYFEELADHTAALLAAERILIIACGTSWHAGYLGAYLMEDLARIPTQIEIASEFRYKNPVVSPGTLAIIISQSGETADTIAAAREVRAKGVPILALCNVAESTLAREADWPILLRVGEEIGVCSTKAFTSQVILLSLLALKMARMRHLSRSEGQSFLYALKQLPEQVTEILAQAPKIASLASKYASYHNFFFVGRSYMYPTCLEGALKLKEISYINANGYPAGEMKHGPIALIDEQCPTMAFCCNRHTFEKLLSNLMEIKARRGLIIAIAEEGSTGFDGITDDLLFIPSSRDELAAIPTAIAAQLFAYFVAKERDVDIDHPRNLAKSVTVE